MRRIILLSVTWAALGAAAWPNGLAAQEAPPPGPDAPRVENPAQGGKKGKAGGDKKAAQNANVATRRETEEGLAAFIRQLYASLAAEDKALRQETLASVLPTEEDFQFLFPKDAALLYPLWENKILKVRQDAPQMKDRSKEPGYLDNIISNVELVNLRDSKAYGAQAKALISLLPVDVPVYRAITHRNDKGEPEAESGPYLRIRERWVWAADLDLSAAGLLESRGGKAKAGKPPKKAKALPPMQP
jgi:hypothetical protein